MRLKTSHSPMREVKTADLNYKCYFNVVIKNNNQTNDDIN